LRANLSWPCWARPRDKCRTTSSANCLRPPREANRPIARSIDGEAGRSSPRGAGARAGGPKLPTWLFPGMLPPPVPQPHGGWKPSPRKRSDAGAVCRGQTARRARAPWRPRTTVSPKTIQTCRSGSCPSAFIHIACASWYVRNSKHAHSSPVHHRRTPILSSAHHLTLGTCSLPHTNTSHRCQRKWICLSHLPAVVRTASTISSAMAGARCIASL